MGKNAREKKLEKIEQEMAEKRVVELRRAERIAPIIITIKRLSAAVLATIFILYLGVMINSHLPEIVNRLTEKGS
ncbi:MAG: hypothetical protein WD157_00125 [Patescibacteria group bacterium]